MQQSQAIYILIVKPSGESLSTRLVLQYVKIPIDRSFFSTKDSRFLLVTTVTVISHYVSIPFTRGFFCSDMTIKYPYKTDTIPAYAAVLLSIGLPIVWVRWLWCSILLGQSFDHLDVDNRIRQTILFHTLSETTIHDSFGIMWTKNRQYQTILS